MCLRQAITANSNNNNDSNEKRKLKFVSWAFWTAVISNVFTPNWQFSFYGWRNFMQIFSDDKDVMFSKYCGKAIKQYSTKNRKVKWYLAVWRIRIWPFLRDLLSSLPSLSFFPLITNIIRFLKGGEKNLLSPFSQSFPLFCLLLFLAHYATLILSYYHYYYDFSFSWWWRL